MRLRRSSARGATAPLGQPEPPLLPPADAARDNARRGSWAMNEWYDGWVLLGGDGKPVMRNDRSRVGFRFDAVARLADELAAQPDDVDSEADPRRALAPLDSAFNKDWDPQRPKSTLADMTKWTRLLAYHYVQTTEPEEAVRRAVSMIFGNPVIMDESGTKLWVPTKYDAEAVKSVAGTLLRQAAGPEAAAEDSQDPGKLETAPTIDVFPTTRTVRGVPIDRRSFNPLLETVSEVNQAEATDGAVQVAQANPGGLQQPQPAKGERRPPGQYKERQTTNLQPAPPAAQPASVVQALKQNHLTQAWRDRLAQFETGGKPHDGYGTYLFQGKGFAYGRYQFRTGGLKDAGMMDMKTGDWTGKYGINSWRDFLNNPQAQEAALKDLTHVIETRYIPKHLSDMGRTIKSAQGDIKITSSGFIGACHQAGTGTMDDYFRWAAANNWDTRGKPMPDLFKDIEKRMKAFENIPYR